VKIAYMVAVVLTIVGAYAVGGMAMWTVGLAAYKLAGLPHVAASWPRGEPSIFVTAYHFLLTTWLLGRRWK